MIDGRWSRQIFNPPFLGTLYPPPLGTRFFILSITLYFLPIRVLAVTSPPGFFEKDPIDWLMRFRSRILICAPLLLQPVQFAEGTDSVVLRQ
ncbi:hypothetical protein AVEN_164286-1 [Araneus ventricosus]|uniref:Uncharacterized protein n=1 Tax=Araneus ventricosus TaxID=182803 RepID=A0A4Y2GWE3_ARAVE|nr:hypothetical protein AVEN_164286-1 [Araneus ventricosus]